MRNEEIRIRVTPDERESIKNFIKSGKEQGIWSNNRTCLKELIDYWNKNHIKGKFI